MRKIVINNCYGGFGLSYKAVMRYAEIKGIKLYAWLDDTTRKVYGDEARIGNNTVLHHYSTTPVINGEPPVDAYYWSPRDVKRDDPALVQVVEEMGEEASGRCAKLKIVKIPDGVEFTIGEYDGNEWVAETHRTWA